MMQMLKLIVVRRVELYTMSYDEPISKCKLCYTKFSVSFYAELTVPFECDICNAKYYNIKVAANDENWKINVASDENWIGGY